MLASLPFGRTKMFYDVPCVSSICFKTGQMLYAIFDDPFEAMSYAHRNRINQGFGFNLQVNRRHWDPTVFANSRIYDCRLGEPK